MAIDYVSTHPVNLQEAVRDLDKRLKAIEHKPAPVAESEAVTLEAKGAAPVTKIPVPVPASPAPKV